MLSLAAASWLMLASALPAQEEHKCEHHVTYVFKNWLLVDLEVEYCCGLFRKEKMHEKASISPFKVATDPAHAKDEPSWLPKSPAEDAESRVKMPAKDVPHLIHLILAPLFCWIRVPNFQELPEALRVPEMFRADYAYEYTFAQGSLPVRVDFLTLIRFYRLSFLARVSAS